MGLVSVLSFILALAFSLLATKAVASYARRSGLLDIPNARSSHSAPMPRGGGLAIVVTVLGGVAVLAFNRFLSQATAGYLGAAAALIAAISYLDDRYSLPALPRFSVHVLTSAVVVLAIFVDGSLFDLSVSAWVLGFFLIIATVWSVNLFNFMDGIDGLAASQAVFIAVASALLCVAAGEWQFVPMLLITAGASMGFLIWNWPPAKIFMGDIGSAFLGLWIATSALMLYHAEALNIWTSVALNALFIADATATLIRRVLSGKKWYEPHRTHAYQCLSRRWGSHRKVTCASWLINALLVLPVAGLVEFLPQAAPYVTSVLILIFMMLALALGAGRDEGDQMYE